HCTFSLASLGWYHVSPCCPTEGPRSTCGTMIAGRRYSHAIPTVTAELFGGTDRCRTQPGNRRQRVIPRSRSAFLVNRELLIGTGTRPCARSERSSVRAGPLRS